MTSTEWEYETAPDLDQSLLDRIATFPREPEIGVYVLRSLAAILLRGWLRLYHRYRIVGRENLPRGSSFILVCNHSSHLDTMCLVSAIPLRRLHQAFPAAAEDYFFSSLPRSLFAAIFINGLPFSRKLRASQSIQLCSELLLNPGNILILFPEGTRTTTGELGPFKPGIGRLVVGAPASVVPCYLDGAFNALPKGSRVPRPTRLTLFIGEPLSFADQEPTREAVRAASALLQEAVGSLRP